MTSPENKAANLMQGDEDQAAMLRIIISELPAPFSELTVEEYKELQARHLGRSAQNLDELSLGETKDRATKPGLYEGLGLVDSARTRRSQSRALAGGRGLYEDLTIRDRSRSKAQSRIIGGMPKGGRS